MTKQPSRLRLNLAKYWQLYTFLIIPMGIVLIFSYYPMFGIQIAFKDFNAGLGIWGSPWVGLKHFTNFFSSYQFDRVFFNTIILSFYSLIAGFPIPIILALALNVVKNDRYKKTVQMITYMPHFISMVVLVGMLIQVANPVNGLYGHFYQLLFGDMAPDILGSPGSFRHLYVWSGVWQSTGWSTIIYVSALTAVDPALHESAEIDGASRFKRVLYIDFPSILPTATIMLIMSAGSIMSVGFEKVYLMQNSLNLRTSEVISTYVYKVGLAAGGGDFSYATAIGLFNSVVNLIMIFFVNGICRKFSNTSLW